MAKNVSPVWPVLDMHAEHKSTAPRHVAGLLELRFASRAADDSRETAAAERIAVAAWEGTVSGLSATWPALRQVLLAGAVQRLTEPGLAGGRGSNSGHAMHAERSAVRGSFVEGEGIGRAQRLGLVVQQLLRQREKITGKQLRAGAKRKAAQDAADWEDTGWRPAPEQARQLLGRCLRAFAASAAGSSGEQAAQAGVLRSAAAALLRHSGSGGGSATRLQQLLKLAAAEGSGNGEQHMKGAGATEATGVQGDMAQQREALHAAQSAQAELLERRRGHKTASAPPDPDRC